MVDVYTYSITIALEFSDGRLRSIHAKALSPRGDWLFPQEHVDDSPYTVPDVRGLTDWVRNMCHEIKETEWFEAKP